MRSDFSAQVYSDSSSSKPPDDIVGAVDTCGKFTIGAHDTGGYCSEDKVIYDWCRWHQR